MITANDILFIYLSHQIFPLIDGFRKDFCNFLEKLGHCDLVFVAMATPRTSISCIDHYMLLTMSRWNLSSTFRSRKCVNDAHTYTRCVMPWTHIIFSRWTSDYSKWRRLYIQKRVFYVNEKTHCLIFNKTFSFGKCSM